MTPHPAAERYPMLDAKRYESLRESIRANGVRHPVVVFEGQILDGRNRWKACAELGLECPTVEHDGSDPFLFAWDANGERRDLNADQRYLLWKYAQEDSAAWQEAKRQREEAANRARSEAARARPRNDDGTLASVAHNWGYTGLSRAEETHRPITRADRDQAADKAAKTSTAKAEAARSNRTSVERMDHLHRERPDLAAKVAEGAIRPTQALRELKREQVADKVAALPEGQYRVIYADPPWKYGDERIGLGDAYTAAETHYPTMSKAELCALDVSALTADDSVLMMWATFPLLPDALDVLKAWGFAYKTAIVWDKEAWNVGNYHDASAELLLIGTRGSCLPTGREPVGVEEASWRKSRARQVQRHPRLAHSAKPEHFRALIDAMYPEGPRIELFRRGDAPEGWAIWGNEAA